MKLAPTARPAGTTVFYQIVVTNSGNVTLTGVTLTDSLGLPASCVVPATLAPGASFTCVYSRVINSTTTNTATADADQVDPGQAQATVTVPGVPPTATPTATPTSTVEATATASPSGTVLSVTSPPKPIVTLPPTDTLPGYGQSGANLALVLGGLALLMAAGFLAVAQKRRDRRLR